MNIRGHADAKDRLPRCASGAGGYRQAHRLVRRRQPILLASPHACDWRRNTALRYRPAPTKPRRFPLSLNSLTVFYHIDQYACTQQIKLCGTAQSQQPGLVKSAGVFPAATRCFRPDGVLPGAWTQAFGDRSAPRAPLLPQLGGANYGQPVVGASAVLTRGSSRSNTGRRRYQTLRRSD